MKAREEKLAVLRKKDRQCGSFIVAQFTLLTGMAFSRKWLGTNQKFSTPYRHEGNALAERPIQTVKETSITDESALPTLNLRYEFIIFNVSAHIL